MWGGGIPQDPGGETPRTKLLWSLVSGPGGSVGLCVVVSEVERVEADSSNRKADPTRLQTLQNAWGVGRGVQSILCQLRAARRNQLGHLERVTYAGIDNKILDSPSAEGLP